MTATRLRPAGALGELLDRPAARELDPMPGRDRDERLNFLVDVGAPEPRQTASDFFQATIAGASYLMALNRVAAVLEPEVVVSMDGAGAWSGEIVSRRGPIPVAAGAEMFPQATHADVPGKVLVLHGQRTFGVSVDAVSGSTRIDQSDLVALPIVFGTSRRLLLTGFAWTERGIARIIDVDLLAAAIEQPSARAAGSGSTEARAAVVRTYHAADFEQVIEVDVDGSGASYAFPAACVRHIATLREPAPLARAGAATLGILSWRRQPIPVIDAARCLGFTPLAARDTLIVAGPPGAMAIGEVAFLVHSVATVHRAVGTFSTHVQLPDSRSLPLIDIVHAITRSWAESGRARKGKGKVRR